MYRRKNCANIASYATLYRVFVLHIILSIRSPLVGKFFRKYKMKYLFKKQKKKTENTKFSFNLMLLLLLLPGKDMENTTLLSVFPH